MHHGGTLSPSLSGFFLSQDNSSAVKNVVSGGGWRHILHMRPQVETLAPNSLFGSVDIQQTAVNMSFYLCEVELEIGLLGAGAIA